MTNNALKDAIKDTGSVVGLSNKDKTWLVNKLLEIRDEPHDDSVLTEIRTWSEWTVEVYKLDGGCKIGYVARNYVALFPESILNRCFARVLRLKDNSEFQAEKNESLMRGGVCLVETVIRVEHFQ
jgi:hypothetical protein